MAIGAAKNGDSLDRDIEKYRKALEEDPRSRYFAPLADALRRKGEIKAAIEVAEKGVENHPRYLSGIVVAAQAYKDDKQLERSLELFQQAARMNPENAAAQKGLAEIYDIQGDHHLAYQAYSALTLLDPFDVKAKERLMLLEATMPRTPPPYGGDHQGSDHSPSSEAASEDETSFADGGENWKVKEPGKEEAPLGDPAEAPPPLPEELQVPPDLNPVDPPAEAEDEGPAGEESPPEGPLQPPPLPDDEKTTEFDSPSPDEKSTSEAGEGSSTLIMPPEPAAALADERDQPAEDSPTEIKTPLPAPITGAREPTGKRTPPPDELTEEDKLDAFFAAVPSREPETESAEEFVVKKADEALNEVREKQLDDYFGTTSPEQQAAREKAADRDFKITQSEEGERFWSRGHYNRALMAMAHQLWADPINSTLREEFREACEILERDPESVLDEARDLEERLQGTRVDRETARGGRRPPAVPLSPPDPVASEPAEPEPVKTEEPEPEPEPGAGKAQVLRSYLTRIRKDKEKTP